MEAPTFFGGFLLFGLIISNSSSVAAWPLEGVVGGGELCLLVEAALLYLGVCIEIPSSLFKIKFRTAFSGAVVVADDSMMLVGSLFKTYQEIKKSRYDARGEPFQDLLPLHEKPFITEYIQDSRFKIQEV